jgi:hypothetical protein
MPFKHNAARRRHIPRARYRVMNWPAHEAGLQRRGDLTLWLDQAALAGWAAPKRSSPSGQPLYSDLAIELVLTLQLVFHLALRQAEAFSCSVLRLLDLALPVPDHSTLSCRSWAFAGRQPRVQASNGPTYLVLCQSALKWGSSAALVQVVVRFCCKRWIRVTKALSSGAFRQQLRRAQRRR